jgi:hypothetical protein
MGVQVLKGNFTGGDRSRMQLLKGSTQNFRKCKLFSFIIVLHSRFENFCPILITNFDHQNIEFKTQIEPLLDFCKFIIKKFNLK